MPAATRRTDVPEMVADSDVPEKIVPEKSVAAEGRPAPIDLKKICFTDAKIGYARPIQLPLLHPSSPQPVQP